MHENEFEKKVREIMDEFKIDPSDSVWNKVEQHIPKVERRRRWVIFFFLFAGLLVSGYFTYNNYHNNSAEIKNVSANNQNDKTTNSSNKNKEQANASITTQQDDSKQKVIEEKNTIAVSKKTGYDIVLSVTKDKQPHNKVIEKSEVQTLATNETKDLIKDETTTNRSTETNIINDTASKNTTTFDAVDTKQKDTLSKRVFQDTTQAVAVNSNKKRSLKQIANKKWQFGGTAFYGRSDVFENLLGVKLNSASPSFNADPGTVTGFPRTPHNLSNNTKAKGAFSIGVVARKELTSKSNLTIGLQYSKFQTEVETGAMEDSAATFRYSNLNAAPQANLNNFYKPGSGYFHKNSYSFIQIPVIYEHSLIKNKLLNWNAGVSLSRLISSNALVYDNYNQAYYNNNDLFRKTHITLLAGINTQFKLGKTPVDLGPKFQYGLTNLFKHNNYGRQHLFILGLQANIFLKK